MGLATVFLWDLQMMGTSPSWPFNTHYLGSVLFYYITDRKIEIGIILGSCLYMAHALVSWLPPFHTKKKLVDDLLRHMMKERFPGTDVNLNRATLYCVRSGFSTFIFTWLWRCLIINALAHAKKGCYAYYCKHPPNPFRKYLQIYSRKGQPHEKGSSTAFLVPQTENEVEGIAADAFYREQTVTLELPDIRAIDLTNVQDLKDIHVPKDKKAITRYMHEGKIADFQKLKTIHRYSVSFLATPLWKNEKKWGVLILDSNVEDLFVTRPGLERSLVSYSRGIESILRALPT